MEDTSRNPRRASTIGPLKPVLHRPLEPDQYTSIRFTETPAIQGLSASIGSIGDAYDNAVAESTFGLYKNEAVAEGSPFRTGPLKTITDVEALTLEYVDWYNNQRLHSLLGNITPEEYEQAYYAQHPSPPPGGAANKTA